MRVLASIPPERGNVPVGEQTRVALLMSGAAAGRECVEDMEACERRQLAEQWAGFANSLIEELEGREPDADLLRLFLARSLYTAPSCGWLAQRGSVLSFAE